MAVEDDDPAPASNLLARSHTTNAVSTSRTSHQARAPDRPIDHAETRRLSGASRPRLPSSNAVESFRAARRASLESVASTDGGTSTPTQAQSSSRSISSEVLNRNLFSSLAVESLCAMRRASVEMDEGDAVHPSDDTDRHHPPHHHHDNDDGHDDVESGGDIVDSALQNALPDREDPIMSKSGPPLLPSMMGSARKPSRFSDANVYLADVERLRVSLGRRRSVDVNDPNHNMETPRLRRSSIGISGMDMEPMVETVEEMGFGAFGEEPAPSPMRSPLKSIVSNRENVPTMSRSVDNLGMSVTSAKARRDNDAMSNPAIRVPRLDDDELDYNEDVEDLGVW